MTTRLERPMARSNAPKIVVQRREPSINLDDVFPVERNNEKDDSHSSGWSSSTRSGFSASAPNLPMNGTMTPKPALRPSQYWASTHTASTMDSTVFSGSRPASSSSLSSFDISKSRGSSYFNLADELPFGEKKQGDKSPEFRINKGTRSLIVSPNDEKEKPSSVINLSKTPEDSSAKPQSTVSELSCISEHQPFEPTKAATRNATQRRRGSADYSSSSSMINNGKTHEPEGVTATDEKAGKIRRTVRRVVKKTKPTSRGISRLDSSRTLSDFSSASEQPYEDNSEDDVDDDEGSDVNRQTILGEMSLERGRSRRSSIVGDKSVDLSSSTRSADKPIKKRSSSTGAISKSKSRSKSPGSLKKSRSRSKLTDTDSKSERKSRSKSPGSLRQAYEKALSSSSLLSAEGMLAASEQGEPKKKSSSGRARSKSPGTLRNSSHHSTSTRKSRSKSPGSLRNSSHHSTSTRSRSKSPGSLASSSHHKSSSRKSRSKSPGGLSSKLKSPSSSRSARAKSPGSLKGSSRHSRTKGSESLMSPASLLLDVLNQSSHDKATGGKKKSPSTAGLPPPPLGTDSSSPTPKTKFRKRPSQVELSSASSTAKGSRNGGSGNASSSTLGRSLHSLPCVPERSKSPVRKNSIRQTLALTGLAQVGGDNRIEDDDASLSDLLNKVRFKAETLREEERAAAKQRSKQHHFGKKPDDPGFRSDFDVSQFSTLSMDTSTFDLADLVEDDGLIS